MCLYASDNEIVVNQTRDIATCMTSGEDIYRTFDNVYFHYHHPCAIGLLVSSYVDIYTFTECDAVDKCACYKVVHMMLQSNEHTTTYILRNKELTITTASGQITRDASSLTPNKPANLDDMGKAKQPDLRINWREITHIGDFFRSLF